MDAYELRIRQTIRNLMEEKKKSADEISATIPVSTATFYRRMSIPRNLRSTSCARSRETSEPRSRKSRAGDKSNKGVNQK